MPQPSSHRLKPTHQKSIFCRPNNTGVKLPHGLAEYTGTSALRDRRFNPVESHELPTLQCGVSLLVQFEYGKDYLDWEVGVRWSVCPHVPITSRIAPPLLENAHDEPLHFHFTFTLPEGTSVACAARRSLQIHGIRIHVTIAGREYSATYLPEVCEEQGWGKVDAVNSLLRKAGYTGKVDRSVYSIITLQRYQSRRFHVTYDEWMARTTHVGGAQ